MGLAVAILEVTVGLAVPIVRAYAACRRGPAPAAENFGVFRIGYLLK